MFLHVVYYESELAEFDLVQELLVRVGFSTSRSVGLV
jgi:hypothetical protein